MHCALSAPSAVSSLTTRWHSSYRPHAGSLADNQKSCSSIGKNQVPQPSTDTNDIVLKVLYAVAEGMHQNVVALHATDRMLDKDADLTEGFILSHLLNTERGTGVLFTLARFLCRNVNLLTPVIRFDT